jgi:hypothetical protein
MRRLFWLAMGVTIGALIVRKLSRAAERMTPSGMANGLAAGLGELSNALRDFAADVREAMHDHEATLRAGAGMDGELGAVPTPPAAPAGTQGSAERA